MHFEETKTVKSYFSCSLSSLLGFWVVLEPFGVFFLTKTTHKLTRDDNEQLEYDLTVLVSSKFIFNPLEWVTCEYSSLLVPG